MFPVEKHNQQIQELCIALIFLWETTPACGSGLVDLITKSQSSVGFSSGQWVFILPLVMVTGSGMGIESQSPVLPCNW